MCRAYLAVFFRVGYWVYSPHSNVVRDRASELNRFIISWCCHPSLSYHAFCVHLTGPMPFPSPPPPPPPERRFEYLTDLVRWIENQKYEQAIVGRYVGGLYIAE